MPTNADQPIIVGAIVATANRRARWARRLLAAFAFVLAVPLALAIYAELRYRGRVVRPSEAPRAPIALVFGAGLARGGIPSPVLRQRLDRAVGLYRAGTVEKIFV